MNENIIIGSDAPAKNSGGSGWVLLFVAVLVAVGVGWYLFANKQTTTAVIPVIPLAPATTTKPIVSSVKIAFLDGSGEGSGKSVGCDTLSLVEVPVSPTSDPVGVSLEALFEPATTTDLVVGNFVGDQANLEFEKFEMSEGDAHVYLVGSVEYSGVCDDPRLSIQIEETVRANADVGEVEIFLNGDPYEVPNAKGD